MLKLDYVILVVLFLGVVVVTVVGSGEGGLFFRSEVLFRVRDVGEGRVLGRDVSSV